MPMRFAQRPKLLCPPSCGSSHSTHLALDILQTGCNSLEFCLCAREFSRIPTIPAEIRTSPLSMCSLLTTVGSGRFCPEARSQTPALYRALTNGKYGENGNYYRCLARERSGTRRSILGARLQRSCKLATHYQNEPIRSIRESSVG